MAAPIHMKFTFRTFDEDRPGKIWQKHFKRFWPGYRRWFLRYGERDRPTYFESIQALRKYIPEFLPHYEAMTELAGGGDYAARFLAQYCPPPLFRGCSQAVYLQDEAVLVRNYDYSPYVFDGLVMQSRFEQRGVVAMIDCMSGALDGINSDGLAVSLSFGGREEFGTGFGIPLLMRCLLEFAGNVAEGREWLRRIPVHGAYNVTMLDADNHFDTVAIGPGQQLADLRGKGRHASTLRPLEPDRRRPPAQRLSIQPRVPQPAALQQQVRARLRHSLQRRLLPAAPQLRVFLAAAELEFQFQ